MKKQKTTDTADKGCESPAAKLREAADLMEQHEAPEGAGGGLPSIDKETLKKLLGILIDVGTTVLGRL